MNGRPPIAFGTTATAITYCNPSNSQLSTWTNTVIPTAVTTAVSVYNYQRADGTLLVGCPNGEYVTTSDATGASGMECTSELYLCTIVW